MKFLFIYFDKTALFLAIEKRNFEIINLLLDRNDIDLNAQGIFNGI